MDLNTTEFRIVKAGGAARAKTRTALQPTEIALAGLEGGLDEEKNKMAELKRTIKVFGNDTVVADVPVVKAVEHFNEYELEDGSVLRVKNVPHSILRVEGQFDANGKPVYIVLTTPVVAILSSLLSSAEVN